MADEHVGPPAPGANEFKGNFAYPPDQAIQPADARSGLFGNDKVIDSSDIPGGPIITPTELKVVPQMIDSVPGLLPPREETNQQDDSMEYHGGYTGHRVSQMPGVVGPDAPLAYDADINPKPGQPRIPRLTPHHPDETQPLDRVEVTSSTDYPSVDVESMLTRDGTVQEVKIGGERSGAEAELSMSGLEHLDVLNLDGKPGSLMAVLSAGLSEAIGLVDTKAGEPYESTVNDPDRFVLVKLQPGGGHEFVPLKNKEGKTVMAKMRKPSEIHYFGRQPENTSVGLEEFNEFSDPFDSSVSRKQLGISVLPDGVLDIIDDKSKNGTRITVKPKATEANADDIVKAASAASQRALGQTQPLPEKQ